MKIAVLGHRRFPIKEPFAGGIERFTHTIVTELAKKGCQVTLFAHPESDRRLNLSLEPILDTSFCLNHEEESHEAYLNIMDYLSTEDFDLVHDNSLNYFPIILEDRLSAPLVTTLHTPPFSRLLSAIRYRERKKRGHYISISEFNTKLWGLDSDRLETIHNGVDTKVFGYLPFYHQNCAVWTGRIIPDKGTHLAIEAAQKAKIQLIIAGKIGDREYFATKIAPHLGKGIEYVGHLKEEELVPLLQSAAMTLCTPVWSEPFGLVVIESLACGTPVVAFDRGAMSEILDCQTGILVPPNDTDAMAEAMKQVKRLSRYSCRKLALERFSLETMIDKYIQAFERIINRHKEKSCTLGITYTSTAEDTLNEPKRSLKTSISPLPSSALELVNKTGRE
ncbi:glycosyltransferase family 4 protein [Pleurocapsa sp. FMAR1]|uniref:glycosyltransferase family 4 protein n=1 Tax=Pleurocapsa sp. FMAR1 TaxID=3040204 RepID=UPI0029C9A25B|nr:glycosyltransferase family 4 protein [Pleurocapsa sp. FMAR1]